MQKTRSIFVKVLVLVCALCCSLAFVFGLTGCSNEEEPSAPETITVTKVEVIEGTDKIKVTYSNGTTAEFDNTVVATCEHNLKEYWVKPATCVTPEEFLKVCDKGCGYADIEYGDVDADNHVVDVNDPAEEYVEEVKPTCTTAGSIKVTCACGEVLADNPNVPALDHDFETTYPTCEVDGYKTCKVCEFVEEASDENGLKATGHDAQYVWKVAQDLTGEFNICVDGGHEVFVCPTCFAKCPECENAIKDTKEIPATGHTITPDWEVVVEPTLESAGSFAGFCDVCKTNATIVLPALNDEDYNVSEVTPAQCNAKGEDQYVFVYYGNEVDECTFTVVTETAHIDENGEKIDKNRVYPIAYVEAHGYVEVDSNATCLDKVRGALFCSVCDGMAIVDVIGEHVYGSEITEKYVAPTCVSVGYKYFECTREGCTEEAYEILDKVAHDYDVTVDEANKKLVFTCKGNPAGTVCGHTFSADLYAYEYRTVPATCYTDGSKTFWYQEAAGAEWKNLPGKVIPAYGHYYGDPDNKLVKDKEYEYKELVEIFGEGNIGKVKGFACVTEVDSTNNCSVSAQASAYCTECGGMVIFNALGNHVWKETGSFEATCTEDAYKTYVCEANAEHTDVVVEEGTKLGHSLVLDMAQSDITGTVANMVFVCERGCGYTDTIVGTIIDEVNVDSTCVSKGYHYIDYTYDDPNLGTVQDRKYLIQEKPLSTIHTYETTKMDKASYTYSELVEIFGEANIGKTEGYKLVTEVDSAFDCQNSAQAAYFCTICNGMKFITATGDHDWNEWTEVDATCTEDSYKFRTCKVEGCPGYEADAGYVSTPATGHTYVYELPEASALVEGSFDMVVTCEDCDYEFTFTFNKLNADDYLMEIKTPNSCASEGLTTYTIDVKDGDKVIETVKFSITTPVTEHEGAEPPVEKTWEHDGYIYEGYYCEACDTMIITKKTEIVAE